MHEAAHLGIKKTAIQDENKANRFHWDSDVLITVQDVQRQTTRWETDFPQTAHKPTVLQSTVSCEH